jgi:hypothetical protein
MTPDRCYDPTRSYRPQWARKTPAGYRDETFLIPFQFLQVAAPGNVETRQLPWTLDDDQDFILDGIFFAQIGTMAQNATLGNGLCRIWDCQGNPLSLGLVLGLGFWGNAGIGGFSGAQTQTFGWGWPFEDEIICPAGGTLLFDFLPNTTATIAYAQFIGVLELLTFYAGVYGTAGNAFTIEMIDPLANNVPLSVALVGNDVQVTLATDGGGAITSTFQDVADIINNTPALAGIMLAFLTGTNPLEVVTAMAQTPLTTGAAATPVDYYGTLIGRKRFKDC